MSSSEDYFSFRTRGELVRVTRAYPCPVCGHDGYCQVTAEGDEAWCMRCEEGSVRVHESTLGMVYVHALGECARLPLPRAVAPLAASPERAPIDLLDRAHRAVLSQLSLDESDRDALRARGFDTCAIGTNAYRSTCSERGWRVGRTVGDRLGLEVAPRIPGIVWRYRAEEDPESGWLHWRAPDGLLIPVRDLEGRIVAMKVRRRDDRAVRYGRYAYVTSAARPTREGEASRFIDLPGPTALCAVHVPVAAQALRSKSSRLIITEGELKADVATALLGEPVVSIPGVGAWKQGVALARAWGASEVQVAFDMDAELNPVVAQARDNLVSALRHAGLNVTVRTWPYDGTRWKGLDDHLLAMRRENQEVRYGR